MCQPEILLSPFSLEAVSLSASPVLLPTFFQCIIRFRINTFGQLTAQTWSFFHHLVTCAATFHTAHSYSSARIHPPNMRARLLCTTAPLHLSAAAFECEGSSGDLAYVHRLLHWTLACWHAAEGANGRSHIHTLILCGRKKKDLLGFAEGLSNVMQHVASYFSSNSLSSHFWSKIVKQILKQYLNTWVVWKGGFSHCSFWDVFKRQNMNGSDCSQISSVSSQWRLPGSPTGPVWPCTMHGLTGPLVLVCLPLSLHPLYLLASFHGNNRKRDDRERKTRQKQRKPPKNVVSSLTPVESYTLFW